MIPLKFDVNSEETIGKVRQINQQLTNLRNQQEAEENKHGANVGAIRVKYHAQYEKLIKQLPSIHEQANAQIAEGMKKRHGMELEAEKLSSRNIEKVLSEKEEFVKNVNKRIQENKGTAIAKELDIVKRAAQEEVEIYRKVRNEKEGSNGKGIYGIGSSLLQNSGLGGQFSSQLLTGIHSISSGMEGGAGIGSAAAIGGATAAVGAFVFATKEAIGAGLELEHELKQEAIGYQTLGLSANEAMQAVRGDESLIKSEAYKFGIMTSSLREASGAYLKFGGDSDNLKDKLEDIIGIQARTGEGWQEAAQDIAKISDPEVSGRLAMKLKISAEELKNARTEAERLAIINRVLGGTIKGVADQSHDGEGNLVRLKDTMSEMWKSFGESVASEVMPTLDALNDAIHWVGNGFKGEAEEVKRNKTQQEIALKVRKDQENEIRNEAVAIDELIAAYKKEDAQLSHSYEWAKVKYAEAKLIGNKTAMEYFSSYGKIYEGQIKYRKAVDDEFDKATGAKEEKTARGIKGKSALTIFHEEYKKQVDALQISLNTQQSLEELYVSLGYESQRDADENKLRNESHFFGEMTLIDSGGYSDLEREQSGFELRARKSQADLHNDLIKDRRDYFNEMYSLYKDTNKEIIEGEKEFDHALMEAGRAIKESAKESRSILAKAAKDAEREIKPFKDAVKKSFEDVFDPVTERMNELTKNSPKFIQSLLSGLSKAGIGEISDEISKKLFNSKEDNPTEAAISNLESINVTTATINVSGITSQNTGINSILQNSDDRFKAMGWDKVAKEDMTAGLSYTPPREDAGSSTSTQEQQEANRHIRARQDEINRRKVAQEEYDANPDNQFNLEKAKLLNSGGSISDQEKEANRGMYSPNWGKQTLTDLGSIAETSGMFMTGSSLLGGGLLKHGLFAAAKHLAIHSGVEIGGNLLSQAGEGNGDIDPQQALMSGIPGYSLTSKALGIGTNDSKSVEDKAKPIEAGMTAAMSKLVQKGGSAKGALQSAASSALSFIPGIGPILSGIVGALPLSEGVDSVPQYFANGSSGIRSVNMKARGSDTVPAMLTPGERVLSVTQNNDLTNLMRVIASNTSRPMVMYNPYDGKVANNQGYNQRLWGVL